MPNKSFRAWESTKQWCVAHPNKPAVIAMVDGHYTLTWNPNKPLQGTDLPDLKPNADLKQVKDWVKP